MQSVYQSLTRVLGFALTESENPNAKEFAETEAQLKILAESSKAIQVLAKTSDKGHAFLAQELEKSAALAYSKFKSGYSEQARYHISDVVNACFGCHSSRSSESDSQFTLNFEKEAIGKNLDPLAKARFLALSRQFDRSLTEYETILLSGESSEDQILNFDPLLEYLIIALRVKNDTGRAEKTLQALEKSPLPEVLKGDVKTWRSALKKHASDNKKSRDLKAARALIQDARASTEFPMDRRGVVQYILASKILNEYLKTPDLPKADKAEAYYELGACELVLGNNLFPDEASVYFEESIRLLPKSKLAQKAYARYEENILYGYSGSSGINLPADEKKKLDELKKIAH